MKIDNKVECSDDENENECDQTTFVWLKDLTKPWIIIIIITIIFFIIVKTQRSTTTSCHAGQQQPGTRYSPAGCQKQRAPTCY